MFGGDGVSAAVPRGLPVGHDTRRQGFGFSLVSFHQISHVRNFVLFLEHRQVLK